MKKTVHGKGRRAKVLEPFNLDSRTWFYAEASGFIFVRQVYDDLGAYRCTERLDVPAHVLRKALALLEKAK